MSAGRRGRRSRLAALILLPMLAGACGTFSKPLAVKFYQGDRPASELALIRSLDPKLQVRSIREQGGTDSRPLADSWFGSTGTGYEITVAPGAYDITAWYEYVDTLDTRVPWWGWYIHQKSETFVISVSAEAGHTYNIVFDRIMSDGRMRYVVVEE